MTLGGRGKSVGVALLLAAFLALGVRLSGFVLHVARSSLQMDFAAFYTAGEAVGRGLSPYVNHVGENPPLWDGVDPYRHSRFLYPPIVARLFQPLALLPYHEAKLLWMLLSLAALAAALLLSMRLAGLAWKPVALLAVVCLAAGYHPLLTLLERGQLDSVILLMLVASVACMRSPRSSYVAGALLALATLLKLHVAFALPFLLVRRRWKTAAGFIGSGVLLLLISILVDGHAAVSDYVFEQLPRIARHGEGGTQAMRLPSEAFARVRHGVGPESTVMDGRVYEPESMRFVLNASLVRTPVGRTIWSSLRKMGLPVAPAHVSIVLLGPCFLLLLAWQARYRSFAEGLADSVYWQIVWIVILLCAPVTWAMGTVWLLPIGAMLLSAGCRSAAALTLGGLGLMTAGVPDGITTAVLSPFGERAFEAKYVVAEILCLAGLFALWRASSRPARDD